jgi:hypothetical protein
MKSPNDYENDDNGSIFGINLPLRVEYQNRKPQHDRIPDRFVEKLRADVYQDFYHYFGHSPFDYSSVESIRYEKW